MNESVTLDYLLSNSNGTTFHFDDRNCPTDLVKEAILRGFQVMNYNVYCVFSFGEYQRWTHADQHRFNGLERSGSGYLETEGIVQSFEGFGYSVMCGDGNGNGAPLSRYFLECTEVDPMHPSYIREVFHL